jgi:hypothetical protein
VTNGALKRILCAGLLLPLATPAWAGSREEVAKILESISARWVEAELEAWGKGGPGAALDEERNRVALGEAHRYGFRTSVDAYLTVIHLDPHGVLTVLLPSRDPAAGHLSAGEPSRFPSDPDRTLRAEPPLGREEVFVFATATPRSLRDLGFPPDTEALPVVDGVAASSVARRLRDALAALPETAVAGARIRSRVVGRPKPRTRSGDELPRATYTIDDVVGYFTSPRVRGIRRRALDLHVPFDLA